jgi:2-keto-4-pentenoate hydratase/2-oxohepta-3-ene-1,7-dioic acid hydratase in catechol pathway
VRRFSYRTRSGAGETTSFGELRDDGVVVGATGDHLAVDELRPAPAVPNPGKIVCVGLNYRDHCDEQGIPYPDRPMLFSKFANAVVASGDAIVRPPGTHALDLEVELGVLIGRRASHVGREQAPAHIDGYFVANDVTARDWQGNKAALGPGERGDGQWLRAKGSDTFLPMGPILVTPDEIPQPSALRLRSWLTPASGPNAGTPVPMQDGTAADMIFDVPALIAFISAAITLDPGDVVITGTPSGVGVFRDPPVFLEPGDVVRCEIDQLGWVENRVMDAPGLDS